MVTLHPLQICVIMLIIFYLSLPQRTLPQRKPLKASANNQSNLNKCPVQFFFLLQPVAVFYLILSILFRTHMSNASRTFSIIFSDVYLRYFLLCSYFANSNFSYIINSQSFLFLSNHTFCFSSVDSQIHIPHASFI